MTLMDVFILDSVIVRLQFGRGHQQGLPSQDCPPRNAGILGVPNASGPMSDAEGRKRRASRGGGRMLSG